MSLACYDNKLQFLLCDTLNITSDGLKKKHKVTKKMH